MRRLVELVGVVLLAMGVSGTIDHLAVQPILGFLNVLNRAVFPEVVPGYELYANLSVAALGLVILVAAARTALAFRRVDTVTSRDGTVIGFETVGQGPPMVLVHGGTADRTRWAPVVPLLAERFTVHAMDRRGRGGSGDHPEYDLRREGEDVAAVVEAVGTDVFLVGHSYGALCSLEAALLTDAIGRIVLYEPPAATPGRHVADPSVRAALQAAATPEDLLTTFFRGALHLTDTQIDDMRDTPVWQARLAAAPTIVREIEVVEVFDISARLSAITVPVRLLLGTESPAYFRPAAEAIVAQLPDAEIVSLDGQAHLAINEDPLQFVEKVVSFRR